jgi:hypothetical protein
MLAINAMQMARLVELTVLRRDLGITVRVIVVGATSVEAVTIVVASRPAIMSRPAITLATPHSTVVVSYANSVARTEKLRVMLPL